MQEKRLEAAREEERMLEQERQFQEELGPWADKSAVKASKASVNATSKDQVRIGPAAKGVCTLFKFVRTFYVYVLIIYLFLSVELYACTTYMHVRV